MGESSNGKGRKGRDRFYRSTTNGGVEFSSVGSSRTREGGLRKAAQVENSLMYSLEDLYEGVKKKMKILKTIGIYLIPPLPLLIIVNT